MLSRINAIRFSAVRVSAARGGLGGTSGCDVTESQASAMLTGRPRKKPGDETGVSASYQLRNPGAMKALSTRATPSDGIWAAIGRFCDRAPFPVLLPGPNHWTAKDFHGHHCKLRGIKDR
jgi:hypothetical protein